MYLTGCKHNVQLTKTNDLRFKTAHYFREKILEKLLGVGMLVGSLGFQVIHYKILRNPSCENYAKERIEEIMYKYINRD